ncbi:MAG: hypothetical protein HN742_00180 [Lentisphaerae bacterium]|jgi:hypothetical protein|nr:hypothetical protein [Lentisphaerota bacterium]MBT4815830.1 hypothetical protein [Lentisphaerota bacterium]MBT5605139.1 hypothetical protein [Lentisphaerota bacterium]MBT7060675.1 hypothetical protein [Lentisphaerota bacterium]MBT7840246.1 hypothetical protein [Lentisphaerota bacterium]
MAEATFKIWQGTPGGYAERTPYIAGFEFAQPTRVDGLRCVHHYLSQMAELSYRLEVWQRGRWIRVRDRRNVALVYPGFMFPLTYEHRFRERPVGKVRIVYERPVQFCCYRLEVLCGDQVVASDAPEPVLEQGNRFGTFYDDAWRTLMAETVASVGQVEDQDRFAAMRDRFTKLHFDRRDHVAETILRRGEPELRDMEEFLPRIRFGSTVIGVPGQPGGNIRVDWNHALLCEPAKNSPEPNNDPYFYFRKRVVFLVSENSVPYGANRDRFSGLKLLRGYLPCVSSRYRHEGVDYRLETFAHDPGSRGPVTFVRMRSRNMSTRERTAQFAARIEKYVFHEPPPVIGLRDPHIVCENGRPILGASAPLHEAQRRFAWARTLAPGESHEVWLAFCPSVYANPGPLPTPMSAACYAQARREMQEYWQTLLRPAVRIQAAEPTLNRWYATSLVQLLLLTDTPNGYLYYGTGCTYDHALYYIESLHGAFALAKLGLDTPGKRCQEGFYTNPYYDHENNPVQQATGKLYYQVKPFRNWACYFAHLTYLYTGDTAWLREMAERLLPRMEALIEEIESTGKGILPPGYFGGDVHDREVYAILADIQACLGLHAFGRLLAALDDPRARRFREYEPVYRQRVLDAMEQTRAQSVWGRPSYTLVLDPHETGYLGERLEAVMDNTLSAYLGLFWSMLLFTDVFARHESQLAEIRDFYENSGAFLAGLLRIHGLQVDNTYVYGYRRDLLLRGEKDRFLQSLFADVTANCTEHFQSSEHWIVVPDKDWGAVEEKHRIGVSEALVGSLRSLCDMFYLEELSNVEPTGTVFIGRGVPDRWHTGTRGFGVRNARLVGGQIDIRYTPQDHGKHITLAVHARGLKRDKQFRIRIPQPDGRLPSAFTTTAVACESGEELIVTTRRSFRITFAYM